MPRSRRVSPWPGPSMASVCIPRRANSSPAKKMLISLALSMPLTMTTVGAGPSTGALIGHLDELDVRMAQPDAGMIAAVGLASPFALFIARENEALGVVIVVAGAQVTVAGGVLAALAGRRVG